MTTTQIIQRARAKLLETTTEILSDDTILLYANLAQQDIFKRAFPNAQILTATVNFSGGISTNLPARFGTLYGGAMDFNNNIFEEISIDDFASAQSGNYVTYQGGYLKAYPDSTTSLTIRYYPTFADISISVNPSIDSYFHELIIYGILSRAYEELQDESLAMYYDEKYEKELAKKIAAQSNYEEGNQRGGQMFRGQQLISDGYWSLGSSPNHF